jgi:hypothetical protein
VAVGRSGRVRDTGQTAAAHVRANSGRASDLFRARRRLRRLLVRWRWLLWLLLQLLLLPLLLLFLLRQVMPDHTTGRRARDGMMTGNVAGDAADDGTLDTTLGQHAV